MTEKFTLKAQSALKRAEETAASLGHTYIGSEHLLYGLIAEKEGVAARILEGVGITAEQIKEAVSLFTGVGHRTKLSAADMTPRTRKIIQESARQGANGTEGLVGTEHLLLSLLKTDDCVAVKLLHSLGANRAELCADLSDILEVPTERKSKKRNVQKTLAPELFTFGRDLTAAAADGKIDPVIGREKEIGRLIRILSRRQKNNPCLIGEPGVGKTAVVEGLAARIADESVPLSLRGKIIFSLDLSSMVAGAKYRGEFEERMKGVVSEIRKNPNILLFIDEIHTIVGAGAAEGAIDAANILKPVMARGEIQVIGATTIQEYRRHIEKDPALERRFQPVFVEEPTPEETKRILLGLKEKYEAHHGLTIDEAALDAAIRLSARYIPDRFFPDKALDLIDEAAAEVRLLSTYEGMELKAAREKAERLAAQKEKAILAQNYEKAGRLRDEAEALQKEIEAKEKALKRKGDTPHPVSAEQIEKTVSAISGIPLGELQKNEGERLLRLEEELSARVIGQEAAISALCRAVRRGRSGVKDPKRPIGSFFFLGPTGVGKTELCKALSHTLFGSERSLIRFDMSEYAEKESISRLLGSPPGYVGYEEGGQLTDRIRSHPYSVVLFDEIEKAHPEIYNILLQIMEDGVLTDSHGKVAQFKNAILILTSNVGAEEMGKAYPLGFADIALSEKEEGRAAKEKAMEALRRRFRPELLNRIDEIVVFGKLTRADLSRIADLLLQETADRLSGKGIRLSYTEAVRQRLVDIGYSPLYGARALRRVVTKEIEDRISAILLKKEAEKGSRIHFDCEDGEIRASVEAAKEALTGLTH